MDKELIIFNLFKDKPIELDVFKSILREKFKIDNYTPLYVKIINYQVDKYGCSLYNTDNEFSNLNPIRRRAR